MQHELKWSQQEGSSNLRVFVAVLHAGILHVKCLQPWCDANVQEIPALGAGDSTVVAARVRRCQLLLTLVLQPARELELDLPFIACQKTPGTREKQAVQL